MSWAAGLPIVGDVIKYVSQRETNRSNETIAKDATSANMADAQRDRDFQASQTSAQMAYQTAEAEKARKWEEQMSNTAYQRASADMKAAGINPILGVQGASTPNSPSPSGASAGGAHGTAATTTLQNPLAHLDLSSAIQAAKTLGEIDNQKKTGNLIDAQAKKVGVDTEVSKKDIPKSDFINKAYQALSATAKDIYNRVNPGENKKIPTVRSFDPKTKTFKLGTP